MIFNLFVTRKTWSTRKFKKMSDDNSIALDLSELTMVQQNKIGTAVQLQKEILHVKQFSSHDTALIAYYDDLFTQLIAAEKVDFIKSILQKIASSSSQSFLTDLTIQLLLTASSSAAHASNDNTLDNEQATNNGFITLLPSIFHKGIKKEEEELLIEAVPYGRRDKLGREQTVSSVPASASGTLEGESTCNCTCCSVM